MNFNVCNCVQKLYFITIILLLSYLYCRIIRISLGSILADCQFLSGSWGFKFIDLSFFVGANSLWNNHNSFVHNYDWTGMWPYCVNIWCNFYSQYSINNIRPDRPVCFIDVINFVMFDHLTNSIPNYEFMDEGYPQIPRKLSHHKF